MATSREDIYNNIPQLNGIYKKVENLIHFGRPVWKNEALNHYIFYSIISTGMNTKIKRHVLLKLFVGEAWTIGTDYELPKGVALNGGLSYTVPIKGWKYFNNGMFTPDESIIVTGALKSVFYTQISNIQSMYLINRSYSKLSKNFVHRRLKY